jgi:LPS O-antigen subunit length determinant protein (WzzB/FepE family)
MDYRQFLRILWARKWIVLMTLLGTVIAVVLSYVLQPRSAST